MQLPSSVTAAALGGTFSIALVLACGSASTSLAAPDDGGSAEDFDATSAPSSSGGSGGAVGVSDGGGSAVAFVRLAHWSPDAPALDVCFNPQGGSWSAQRPVLGNALSPGDAGSIDGGADGDDGDDAPDAEEAGTPGLTFPGVTSYMAVTPGTYAVRLVGAGAADCSTSLVGLAAVTLATGAYTTIAALGEKTPVGTDQPLELAPFADDVTAPAYQIGLRFINASPGSNLATVDFGTGSIAGGGGAFAPLFGGVSFGQTGKAAETDGGSVDSNGYLAGSPLMGATMSAHTAAGAQDSATALNDVTVAGGAAATLALVGGVSGSSSGGTASGASLLLCSDFGDSSPTVALGPCSVVSMP